jgi:GAF domain-containing protein
VRRDPRLRCAKIHVVHLAATDIELIDGFRWGLRRRIRPDATTLESGARVMTEMVYDALGDALLLARTFAALRLSDLPSEERAFALARAEKSGEKLAEDSTVLTLLASRGTERTWNERRASKDHLALPFGSAAQLASAPPMIASLMRAERTFYVFDASTSTDDRGRYTISSRVFVREHDVRTVLGAGTRFGDGTLVAMILFARQHVTRRVAEELEPVVDELVALTARAVAQKKLFDGL